MGVEIMRNRMAISHGRPFDAAASQSLGKYRIAVLGDSISDGYLYNESALAEQTLNTGYVNWATVFSNKTLFFDSTLAHGVGGDAIADCLARTGDVIAANPNICGVLIGSNDVNAATTAADMKSGLTSIYSNLQNAGIVVVAFTIPPRNDATETTAMQQKRHEVNIWMRQYCPRNNILLADLDKYMIDTSTAEGDPITSMLTDGVHPTPEGGYWMGVVLWDILKSFVPVGGYGEAISQLDVYDATNMPLGSLVNNSSLQGTGGTKSVGPPTATGDVADSWIMTPSGASTNSTMVCSMEDKDTGTGNTYRRQKCVFANASGDVGANEEWWFTQTADITSGAAWSGSDKFQEGDIIYAECEVEIEALSNIAGLWLRLFEKNGVDNFLADDMPPKEIDEPLPATFRGKLRTTSIPVRVYGGSGNATIQLRFILHPIAGGNASCTYYISTPVIRKLVV